MRVEQEEDLLAGRAISVVALFVVGVVIAVSVGTAHLLDARERIIRPNGAFPERGLPRPTEQSAVEQEPFDGESQAARRRARDAAVLGSYGWTDRARGIARIPIERAIDLYVAEANAP